MGRVFLLLVLLTLSVISCTPIPYTPQPLAPAEAHSVQNPAFIAYLAENGYTTFPSTWDAEALTHCALFFHPRLLIVRRQWQAAEQAVAAAATRPPASLNTQLAKSNQANDDIRPLAYGLSMELPIDIANRHSIRIEQARHLSAIAKLELAQVAWKLRSSLIEALRQHLFFVRLSEVLRHEADLRAKIVAMFNKRISLGAANQQELLIAQNAWQKTVVEATDAQQKAREWKISLASAIALPIAVLDTMSLRDVTPANVLQLDALEKQALKNRLDLRIALEKYAQAETQLRLEVARQWPEMSLSVGYAYEYGDKVWSLNWSQLLTWLQRNKLNIKRAQSLRQVEAAQVENTEHQILTDVQNAYTRWVAAQQALQLQRDILAKTQQQWLNIQHQLAAGYVGRLDSTLVAAQLEMSKRGVMHAEFNLMSAQQTLENITEHPIAIPAIQLAR